MNEADPDNTGLALNLITYDQQKGKFINWVYILIKGFQVSQEA